MGKITVKEAQQWFLGEIQHAKRTYKEGWLYQGFKDNTIKRCSDYWEKLKNSKAKRSQEIINRFLNEVGLLENLQFEENSKKSIIEDINKSQKINKEASDKLLYDNPIALKILSQKNTGNSDNINILMGFKCELFRINNSKIIKY